jgi:hypothetical protein
VCLKSMSDRPTVQLSGVAKTCELHGVTETGRTELVRHSSHTVVFFLPRMNFLLGKYSEAFICPGIKHLQMYVPGIIKHMCKYKIICFCRQTL